MRARSGFSRYKALNAARKFITLAATNTVCHPPLDRLNRLVNGTNSAAVPLAV